MSLTTLALTPPFPHLPLSPLCLTAWLGATVRRPPPMPKRLASLCGGVGRWVLTLPRLLPGRHPTADQSGPPLAGRRRRHGRKRRAQRGCVGRRRHRLLDRERVL